MTITVKKLYRHTAADIRNQIGQEIGELTHKAADRPDRVADLAISIERLRGQADVLDTIEKQFADIEVWAVKQNWTITHVLLVQLDLVADLATQNPDDTWSGRGNDARRAYNDGRRDVLQYIARQLRFSEHFPRDAK
jgi:hypothetical protein